MITHDMIFHLFLFRKQIEKHSHLSFNFSFISPCLSGLWKTSSAKYAALLYKRETTAPAPAIESGSQSTDTFVSCNGKLQPLREIIESSSSSRLRNVDYDDESSDLLTHAFEIFDEDRDGLFTQSEVTQLIATLSWREYIERMKKSKLENKLMGVMSKTTLAIGVQVTGGVVANAVIIRSSPPSWAAYPVEFAVFLGLCFTLAGLTLRGRRQLLSTVMIKIGAMATASSIIISLASALHPAVAWTVAPLAFLLAAAAVAFAC